MMEEDDNEEVLVLERVEFFEEFEFELMEVEEEVLEFVEEEKEVVEIMSNGCWCGRRRVM